MCEYRYAWGVYPTEPEPNKLDHFARGQPSGEGLCEALDAAKAVAVYCVAEEKGLRR